MSNANACLPAPGMTEARFDAILARQLRMRRSARARTT
jgi:hypothetical protein